MNVKCVGVEDEDEDKDEDDIYTLYTIHPPIHAIHPATSALHDN